MAVASVKMTFLVPMQVGIVDHISSFYIAWASAEKLEQNFSVGVKLVPL